MFEILYQQGRKRRVRHSIKGDRCVIGSARHNDLVLKHRHIAKKHASLYAQNNQVHIEDLGSITGTWVNRERVINYGPINEHDEITIGDVTLKIESKLAMTQQQSTESVAKVAVGGNKAESIGHEDSITDNRPDQENQKAVLYWTGIIHEQLIAEMDLRRKDVHSMSDSQLKDEAESLLDQIILRLSNDLPKELDIGRLRLNVLNEAVGLGPLESFLDDDEITEVMVNNHKEIFVERGGRLVDSGESFSGDQAVMSVIERIITPLGRRIDESSPMVDARLKDGSRVNAIIPPLAIKGPSLTIRKFAKRKLTFEDVIAFGSINQEMVDLDGRYPGYGLARHKGYPTRQHLEGLRSLGVTPIHRRSFAPVKRLLSGS
ncbi:MAG: hypothetical protein B6D79_15330 [gamma proteobacterium symbiont of Ctena orbiculata]|nr:MAG: hypothetical protein B6D79_15330 [gamma proteobacterium symbiont of Ctena orbiculata]